MKEEACRHEEIWADCSGTVRAGELVPHPVEMYNEGLRGISDGKCFKIGLETDYQFTLTGRRLHRVSGEKISGQKLMYRVAEMPGL
jgi:hypothetical protein